MNKAIDVSSYQGVIDWAKVKQSGINYAVLKIIRKDLNLDAQFNNNYINSGKNGVKVIGVYNYSYATTTEKALIDSNKVVNYLGQYNVPKDVIVWLDVEDECQKGLGNLLIDIINVYANIVISSGYKFGIYTGQNFYNTYLKSYSSLFTCPFWIAKYSTIKPTINNELYAWQYTSSGNVSGIVGKVDMNEVYGIKVEAKESVKMPNYAKTVIDIALAEVGYLEKKNGDLKYLYDKTKNAGTANYTKYGKEMHDIYPSVMDYPAQYCDAFVDWCFQKAYGVANAKGLLGGNFDDYTVASAQLYKNKGAYYKTNPKVGDQIFFNNGKRICHTGLVYAVDSKRAYTIEGNTSGASGVVANGGCVAKKSYLLTYNRIDGYGRPKYDVEQSTVVVPKPITTNYPLVDFVKDIQRAIGVGVDGVAGKITLGKTPTVSSKKNNKHKVVIHLQKRLNALGYDCGTPDGHASAKFDTAVKSYQSKMLGTSKPDGEFTSGGKSWQKILGMI